MALKVIQSGGMPPGFFDGVDSELTSFLGGEVCTLIGVVLGTDQDTSAAVDGYVGTTTKTRPAVSKAALTGASRPLYLSDDGILNYGTLFGVVVGASGGQSTGTGLSPVGPHSALASGKITVHNQPGVYGVTLDACDTTSLVPSNAALTVGTALNYTSTGLLTAATGAGTKVATFLEFETNGSLVNSQASLISALNSPSGSVGAVGFTKFAFALFNFNPPV